MKIQILKYTQKQQLTEHIFAVNVSGTSLIPIRETPRHKVAIIRKASSNYLAHPSQCDIKEKTCYSVQILTINKLQTI